MALIKCVECGHEISDRAASCPNCGCPNEVKRSEPQPKEEFKGIYKRTFTGLIEVRCPKCHSEDCRHHTEQRTIKGKTKTQHSLNLNPLKPFTFIDSEEKVVRKNINYNVERFVCNKCAHIFDKPYVPSEENIHIRQEVLELQNHKRSPMAIIGMIFTFFFWIRPCVIIGFLLSVLAIAVDRKKRNVSCSVIGIIISAFTMLVWIYLNIYY